VLTSAQMWDGPVVDDEAQWRDNAEIVKLIATLPSRRVPMEQATAAIASFAAAQPQDKRDERSSCCSRACSSTVNSDRAGVLSGIERFQQRQKARAEQSNGRAVLIRQLRAKAESDEKARA
jgi:hypothetical protein